jgi:hypothetical protein
MRSNEESIVVPVAIAAVSIVWFSSLFLWASALP